MLSVSFFNCSAKCRYAECRGALSEPVLPIYHCAIFVTALSTGQGQGTLTEGEGSVQLTSSLR
jgi:hypothetical protein